MQKKIAETNEELVEKIGKWIEYETNVPFSPEKESIIDYLHDGTVLCKLIAKITNKKISYSTFNNNFHKRENIQKFIEGAREFGLRESDLFTTIQLFEDREEKQVLICLNSLKRLSDLK